MDYKQKYEQALERALETLLKKQGEEANPYSGTSFKYNGHTWGMCARDGGVEILIDNHLKAFVSLDKTEIHPLVLNKTAPKFKVGDIISNGKVIYRIDDITKNCIGQDCYFLVNVESEKNGTRYLIMYDSEGKTSHAGEITWLCEQVDKSFEKKGEQKPTCQLDNLRSNVSFPFKAKVKSNGKIVTIYGGQLSSDGKEWIKYQSDRKDGYKVYEPDNLELVCGIEQKPADKKYTFNAIPRLLSMIQPTDKAKAYCQKLIDILIQEGYSADAKIVGNCLKQMNGEKVAMATMDEQKPADNIIEEEKPLLEKFKQAVYDCAWGKVTCKVEGESKEEYANRWAEQLLTLVRDWADDYIDSREDAIRRRSFDKGRQSIQNSAWGEEDEKNYNTILRIIRDSDVSAQSANRLVSWLKLNTIQSKQEWSEEDVLNLNQAIYVCHQHGYFGVETWLKSLKERIKSK